LHGFGRKRIRNPNWLDSGCMMLFECNDRNNHDCDTNCSFLDKSTRRNTDYTDYFTMFESTPGKAEKVSIRTSQNNQFLRLYFFERQFNKKLFYVLKNNINSTIKLKISCFPEIPLIFTNQLNWTILIQTSFFCLSTHLS